MDNPTNTVSLRALLASLRRQIITDRLSDEQGQRLVHLLESIVRELMRSDLRSN